MRNISVILAAAALVATGTASAQTIGFNGADEIARGDYAGAERMIAKTRTLFPRYPELMLNLAVVYRHTGRAAEARSLYQEVLREPDEVMDLRANRSEASSHRVAQAGLLSLDQRIASAR